MKKLFSDFKKFITKGNVLDLAVGMIIGSAFTAITTALVQKVLNPLLALLGPQNFDSLVTVLREEKVVDGVVTQAAVVIDWGALISAIVNFLLVGFTLFIIVRVFATIQRNMDLRLTVQTKLDKDEPLNDFEKKLLARWQKRNPATAPKKKVAPPPPPQPENERLLAEILAELKKEK